MATEQVTETGINIATYTAEKAAGTVSISKPNKASGNYVYARAKFHPEIQNGVAVIVEDAPELRNINRLSVAGLREALLAQEATIVAARAQLAAIEADMDALDAQP